MDDNVFSLKRRDRVLKRLREWFPLLEEVRASQLNPNGRVSGELNRRWRVETAAMFPSVPYKLVAC